MSTNGWLPEDYMDEMPPERRPQPGDWIERDGDGWRLAPPDDADQKSFRPRKLAHGDVVDMLTLIEHGEIDITISADGSYIAHGDVLQGECYCVPGDIDTFAESFENFVYYYAENMGSGDTERVTCAVYSWPTTKFRFVLAGDAARFEAIEP